ncbi:DUF3073 domain-containing protein [Natronoglycomyces albus]|uniref:DUF3073 domain-containing protein n=1 Tax=Natronoglycomyces albus TaxID=2811108 RepID=A0A895XSQ9_9ACTN|nr:DUF3073 domain-containing protein [Natronoglycomyces albus]QSB05300.1 DUF3073 domain-containing protein [Natronoglycomyces albus]
MGRGRAKAKQMKVARRLKYHSPNTDLRALERELAGGKEAENHAIEAEEAVDEEPDEGYSDPYADYASDDDDGLREEDWLPPRNKSDLRWMKRWDGNPSLPPT